MFVRTYSWLLTAKLLSLLIGGGLLFISWQQTHLAGTPTSSVLLLIDGSASFVSSPDNNEQRSSDLFQQTINHIIDSYPYSHIGVIVASEEPTYLLPDTQQHTSLESAIPQLLSLQQPSEVDRITTTEYLEQHATTGSHVYLLTDTALSPPPAGDQFSQQLKTKRVTVDLLQILPNGDASTPLLQERADKQAILSSNPLYSATDLHEISNALPGSIENNTNSKTLLIAILLLLLGL